MDKILFGQSYYLRFDSKLWQAMQPYPPLGTLYAASYLRSSGYPVALFDAMLAESEADWQQALTSERPRYAVIYEDNFNYLSKMCLQRMRQAAFTMIQQAKQHDCVIIVCGSDATDHYELYIQNGADYVLIGEGEHTLIELLDALTHHPEPALGEILGLAYRVNLKNTDWEIKINPRRPDIKELDSLPFPAWDLVDVPRYQEIWRGKHGYYSMNMVTTRGCPYHCSWCAKPIWGQRYNVRSPENVVRELKWLVNNYKPDHIWFADDIFGLRPGWLQEYARLLEKENLHVPFKCLSRVDLLLRSGEIEAFKRSGAQTIWVGAESGSQKILDAMEKGTTVNQIYEATRAVKSAGIKIAFFLQFGYPGETREEINQTMQMVWDLMPDDIGMSVSYPLPGTKFFTRIKDQLGPKHNWIDSSDLAMMYAGPFITQFYRQLHVVLHKEYRRRKYWRQLKYILSHPTHLTIRSLRQTAVMLFYTVSLPFDRHYLNRLATIPHQGIAELQGGMNYEQASTPDPQKG